MKLKYCSSCKTKNGIISNETKTLKHNGNYKILYYDKCSYCLNLLYIKSKEVIGNGI